MSKEASLNLPSPLALKMAGGAWTTPETSSIVMDEKIAFAFANIIDDILSKPWLGNATTGELLAELTARAEVGGYLNYVTAKNDNETEKQILNLRYPEVLEITKFQKGDYMFNKFAALVRFKDGTEIAMGQEDKTDEEYILLAIESKEFNAGPY